MSQTGKIVSQMRICIDDSVVQFSVITKDLSSDSISLKDLLIGFVIMWFWFKHPIYFNLAEKWIEDLWNRITMNLWLWACWKSFVLHVLCVFFVFEGLWRKFFGALEAWICWASLICDLLRFLKAFGLDSSNLWDLGIWFGWFLFKRSSYLKVCGGSFSGLRSLEAWIRRTSLICDLLRFLEAFELDSSDLWDLGR